MRVVKTSFPSSLLAAFCAIALAISMALPFASLSQAHADEPASGEQASTVVEQPSNDLSTATVLGLDSKTYTGKAITIKPVVKIGDIELRKGTDYKLKFSKNKNAGDAKITITGKGNYKGTKVVTFKIDPVKIASSSVSKKLSKTSFTYNGKVQKPNVTVKYKGKTLKKDKDYRVNYSKGCKNSGTYKVKITGKGNFVGDKILKFKITKPKVAETKTQQPAASVVYWTPYGAKYHSTTGCRSLSRSRTIYSGSIADAISAGRGSACMLCW